MSVTAVVFLVASALYTGFQWTIRVVVYPQFARVPGDAFPDYEQGHQRQVSLAVGPLFAALGLSALAVLIDPPASAPRWATVLAAVLVGAVLVITAVLAVPLHGRLGAAFDRAVHRRLLAVDTARLVVSVATAALAVYLLVD